MALSPGSRTGVAAILAGLLYFAGQAAQLAFGNALTPALGRARRSRDRGFRRGDLGLWWPRQYEDRADRVARLRRRRSAARPLRRAGGHHLGPYWGHPGELILFGLGFLLLFVGHVLIATGLRDALGRAWMLPLVGAAGILVAITLNIDPIHDIGLFVFEGAWVALGIALLNAERQHGAGNAASALV